MILRWILVPAFLVGFAGCGPKGAKLQKSVVPPDRTLFETGSEYLDKSQYIKARLAFQTLINTYPDSELSAESYLAIGDSFYEEAGTENLLQAEDQYKNFIIFFPTHPKAPDAQMKVISLNMKLMRDPDRDPQYSYKAEAAIKRILSEFPDSDFVPIAKQLLREVQENLAMGDFGVGQFYAQRNNNAGARSRFTDVIEKYPDFSLMDEAYWELAQTLRRSNNNDEAAIYLDRIAKAYPFSKRFEEAKSLLKEMGKPVPEVSSELAEANKAKLKPEEGFSPLKPFINFVEALGFKGPEDKYKMARRTIDEKRAVEAAEAARAGESAKSGENILIETTLRKDASGRTETSTTLGGASNPPGDQKDAAKKKDAPKNPKKKATDQ